MGLNNEGTIGLEMTGRPWLVFDIETAPMPGCAQYLTDPIEAPSNYKDPAKIAQYIAEKRQRQIADAALDLDLCEIVAVGVGFSDALYAQTRATTSEEDMLRGFWRFAQTIRSDMGALVGFNILSFDLPVLLRRSLYLGIPTPTIAVDKYRHDGVCDLAHELTFGGRMSWRSLAFYAKRFGLPHDDSVKGEHIPQLVAEGRWDAVEAHVLGDVSTTRALAQRIGVIHQPTPVEEVVA